MSKLTKTYILLFAIAIGWWGGQGIAFLVSMSKMLGQSSPKIFFQDLYQRRDGLPEETITIGKTDEVPIEYTFKPMWSYYFPNYETGQAVKINAIDLDAAKWIAEIRGLGTEEVLSTWRQ